MFAFGRQSRVWNEAVPYPGTATYLKIRDILAYFMTRCSQHWKQPSPSSVQSLIRKLAWMSPSNGPSRKESDKCKHIHQLRFQQPRANSSAWKRTGCWVREEGAQAWTCRFRKNLCRCIACACYNQSSVRTWPAQYLSHMLVHGRSGFAILVVGDDCFSSNVQLSSVQATNDTRIHKFWYRH